MIAHFSRYPCWISMYMYFAVVTCTIVGSHILHVYFAYIVYIAAAVDYHVG